MAEISEQVLRLSVPAEQAGSYHHLPFEMPPGVARLDVRYRYSAAIDSNPLLSGGNCVDIGIFDSRGSASAGFRGWSGSARQSFFIEPARATPGYLPGPLQPGTWQILLGCYKVAPEGCEVEVQVRCTLGDASQPAPAPLLGRAGPASTRPPRAEGWYRGELHCHTEHSDGSATPQDVVAAARALGLDFLAITDHNTVSALAELAASAADDLILIPGSEVTTFRGHWNVWGLNEWVDFRTLTPEALDQAMRWAAARGALVSCNHPKPFGPPWEYPAVDAYQCLEVWNGPWRFFNQEALAFWEAQLRRGRRVTAVGGSDTHHLTPRSPNDVARLGHPTTWIFCPGAPSVNDLLAALRAGHACISAAPDGPRLALRSPAHGALMGDTIRVDANAPLAVAVEVAGGAGLLLELWRADGRCAVYPVAEDQALVDLTVAPHGSPYLRAQLVAPGDPQQHVAISNPLYLSYTR